MSFEAYINPDTWVYYSEEINPEVKERRCLQRFEDICFGLLFSGHFVAADRGSGQRTLSLVWLEN